MPYRYPARSVWSARMFEMLAWPALRARGLLPAGPLSPEATTRILLAEPFQMGDVLSLAVLLGPLRELFPKGEITVLTQPKNAQLLRDDPRVTRTVTLPFPWSNTGASRRRDWIETLRGLRELRAEGGFDLGVDTRGEVRSHLVLALAGCRRRAGYRNYLGSNLNARGLLLTDDAGRLPLMHRYEFNLEVLRRTLGWRGQLTFPSFRPEGIAPRRIPGAAVQIVVHPGAGSPEKHWTIDRWRDLLARIGARASTAIVAIGGPAEADLVKAITTGVPVAHAGITPYRDMVAWLRGADLFIGLDSGPMNLACVLGVPAIALFGPGDSAVWRPLSPRSSFIDHAPGTPRTPDPARMPAAVRDAMQRITVDEVAARVAPHLAQEAGNAT